MDEKKTPGEGKHITWTVTNGVAIVRLRYAHMIRFEAFAEMEAELNAALDGATANRIIINFDVTEHFTSRMLGILAALHKKTRQTNGQMAICRLRPEPMRAFKLCRMDTLIAYYSSEEEARAALGA